jgi:release factor glutamine methyltransferase
VSNPPYISDEEWEDVERNVKAYEPAGALRAGPDGLFFVRRLIAKAHEFLEEEGQLVVEIPSREQEAVLRMIAESEHLSHGRVLSDHEGLPRVLVADRAVAGRAI